LLYGDKLIMQVLQRNEPARGAGRTDGPNESYLLALDAARESRSGVSCGRAMRCPESLEAFTTPTPFEFKGRKEFSSRAEIV
jgi:hypothetical protein